MNSIDMVPIIFPDDLNSGFRLYSNSYLNMNTQQFELSFEQLKKKLANNKINTVNLIFCY